MTVFRYDRDGGVAKILVFGPEQLTALIRTPKDQFLPTSASLIIQRRGKPKKTYTIALKMSVN